MRPNRSFLSLERFANARTVGADLCVCPGSGVEAAAGAPHAGCPYTDWRRALPLVLLALFALAPASVARSQEAGAVKTRYTKHEYQVAMRDGVKLFTSVYIPKDASQ